MRSTSTENIQVVVRCRPLSAEERSRGMTELVEADSASNEVRVHVALGSKKGTKAFAFDRVYNPTYSQRAVFEETVRPLVMQTLRGFNTTVFAYGQTGTGKTFTMEGDHAPGSDHRGMIPRAVEAIFHALEERNELNESFIKASFLEIYNENCTDLLSPDETPLRVLEDKTRGAVVFGLEEVLVRSSADVDVLFRKALTKRKTAPTDLNEKSSRSHSIFTLTVHMKDVSPEGEEVMRVGKINLVDLAGSECVARSGSKNDRAREAGNINQSLLTLGRVITALVSASPHVPYRDSKLTRLLQESLGGCALTCIIATVAPTAPSLEETVSTLEYAARAKSIKNKPVQNQKTTKRAMLKEVMEEMERMRAELAAARAKDGVYLPEDRYQELLGSLQGTTTKATDLELQLERRAADLEQTQGILRETKAELARTQADLASERQKCEERQVLLDAHMDTEARLQDVNDALHRAMETSERITAQLHDKLDRRAAVEARNLRTCTDHRQQAQAALTQLQTLAMQEHAQNLESFKRWGEVFASLSKCVEKDAPVSRESQREHLVGLATTQLEAVLDLFSRYSRVDDEREVEFSLAVSQALTRAMSALQDVVTMTQATHTTLRDTKEQEAKTRQATLAALVADLDKTRAQSHVFLAQTMNAVTDLGEMVHVMVSELAQAQEQASKENDARVQFVQAHIMNTTRDAAAKMEARVQAVMNTAMASLAQANKENGDQLHALAQAVCGKLNESQVASLEARSTSMAKLDADRTLVAHACASLAESMTQHDDHTQNEHGLMMTALRQGEDEAKRVSALFSSEQATAMKDLETFSITEQGLVQQARYDAEVRANGGSALRVERVDNLRTNVTMAKDALRQAGNAGREEAKKSDARASAFLEETNRIVTLVRGGDEAFTAAHAQQVGQLLDHEADFALELDRATGGTPHRNTRLDWPRNVRPATSPHHVILDRVRKGSSSSSSSSRGVLSDVTNNTAHHPITPQTPPLPSSVKSVAPRQNPSTTTANTTSRSVTFQ